MREVRWGESEIGSGSQPRRPNSPLKVNPKDRVCLGESAPTTELEERGDCQMG